MKSALITGASSGIGEALALKYAENGYRVYACGRNKDKLEKLADRDARIEPLAFDITDRQAINWATAHLKNIDLVVLNAGDCEYVDDALNFDAELFERIIRVNLISVGYALQAWLKKINKGGRLVFVSSSVVYLPLPRAEAYGASKAGLSYLAETLSLDLAPHGIDVSLVHPGFVKTPLTEKNDFPMPCLMEVKEAAQKIFNGLEQGKHLVHFPRRFILGLKLLSMLPHNLWRHLINRGNKEQAYK